MNRATLRYVPSSLEGGTRYTVARGGEPLGFSEALDLMARDPGFRQGLTATLAASDCTAYPWETPPLTKSLLGRPFEFVLIDAPGLAPSAEPEVFRTCFAQRPADVDVLAVPNPGNTATLVIPRPLAEPRHCAHLARFVRGAPEAQVHRLWQCVAATVMDQVSTRPLWLSTAGGGVSWLHVRIDRVPKYCVHRPYADAP